MKTVIFCGGRGTRMNEETDKIPKPLIKLSDSNPILWHLMNIYKSNGFNDFILCLGYKGDKIREYFSNSSEFNIKFVDTGIDTGTAGRLLKVQDLVSSNFFVTYGDGLSNINIKNLLKFHLNHGKMVTVSAVRPLVRFGLLDVKNNKVLGFKKRSLALGGWIDGGFFVMEKDIFKYLNKIDEAEMLEGKILNRVAHDDKFMAYKHEDYWKCIDTYRDLLSINKDLVEGNADWMVWAK